MPDSRKTLKSLKKWCWAQVAPQAYNAGQWRPTTEVKSGAPAYWRKIKKSLCDQHCETSCYRDAGLAWGKNDKIFPTYGAIFSPRRSMIRDTRWNIWSCNQGSRSDMKSETVIGMPQIPPSVQCVPADSCLCYNDPIHAGNVLSTVYLKKQLNSVIITLESNSWAVRINWKRSSKHAGTNSRNSSS